MSDFYREQIDEEENIGGNSQSQLDAAVNHNTELINPPEELNLTLNTEMNDFQDGGFESARRGLLPGGIHDEALSPVSKERNHNDSMNGREMDLINLNLVYLALSIAVSTEYKTMHQT